MADKMAQDGSDGSTTLEHIKYEPDGGLHLLVRIERNTTARSADVAAGRRVPQLSAAGLGSPALMHPGLEYVKFCLADRALQSQQQAIVVAAGVVDAVSIPNQRVAKGADLQQLVPVPARPRQPRHLYPENKPDTAETNLGNKTLKSEPALNARPRSAEILVDNQDALA